MKNHSTRQAVEALLGDTRWIGSLARSLVRDAASADDLVQEAMAAALEQPGPALEDARAWAATVLRNLARDGARSSARRGARERRVARNEGSVPASSAAVIAAERQRALTGAVLALEEPYRGVVLMRWFEDLSPREIAKRTRRPVATVKKQLQRGHAQLRDSLEGEFGGQGAWAVALFPLLGSKKVAATAIAGARWTLSALVVAALLAVSIRHWGTRAGDLDQTPVGSRTVDLARVEGPVLAAPGRGEGRGQDASPAAASHAAEEHASHGESSTAPEPSIVHGDPTPFFRARLFDVHGEPIGRERAPGLALEVRLEPGRTPEVRIEDGSRLEPDTDGWVECRALPLALGTRASLRVVGSELVILEIGRTTPAAAFAQVVLCRGVDISGHVVDSTGAPVGGASVRLNADLRALGTYPPPALGLRDHARGAGARWSTESAEDGSFALRSVPGSSLFTLEARDGAGRTASRAAAETSLGGLVLTLRGPDPDEGEIVGRVVDGLGTGLAGVEVTFGWLECESGPDGTFRLALSNENRAYIVEHEEGRLAAVTDDGRFDALEITEDAMGPFLLRIPDAMGEVAGVLIDESGLPLEGVDVFVLDGTRRGAGSAMLEMQAQDRRAGRGRTDPKGRFVIGNLLRRAYTLRFIAPSLDLVLDVAGVRAGDDELLVRVPDDHRVERFEARAVDLLGRPLSGIEVKLFAWEQSADGSSRSSSNWRVVFTDEEGRFVLTSLSRAGAQLAFDALPGDGVGGLELPVEDLDLPGPIELTLDLDCAVTLELGGGPVGARVEFVDAAGEGIGVKSRLPNGQSFEKEVPQLGDGSFRPLLVPQRAVRARVLGADGELLREVPIELTPLARNALVL